MLNLIRDFVQDEAGLEMIEWAIVGALVITASAATLTTLGGSVAIKLVDQNAVITALP